MKPTTKLVIMVVIMALVMALAVAATAIGLSWSTSVTSRKEALTAELGLVTRAVGSFVGEDQMVGEAFFAVPSLPLSLAAYLYHHLTGP